MKHKKLYDFLIDSGVQSAFEKQAVLTWELKSSDHVPERLYRKASNYIYIANRG